MTTTLLACCQELSKQMGDSWQSATTSAGAAGGTTLIDTALSAKAADWIPDEAYDFITEAAHARIYEERKISSLSSSTLTVLAHGGQIGTGVDYEIHRLFSPSDKKKALIYAARALYPYCFKEVRNETRTTGDWLLNGDMETWTLTTIPDNWTASNADLTVAENTNKLYVKRGSSSCKLTYGTATHYIYQDQATFTDWFELSGQGIWFSAMVWASVASQIRLAIYDGTTTTYSSYHTGGSTMEYLEVSLSLANPPKELELRVYMEAAGSAYVDDVRMTGGRRHKVKVSDLSLVLNRPHRVSRQRATARATTGGLEGEPWLNVPDTEIKSDGYLYYPYWVPDNYKMRIEGIGLLDFGAEGWANTIDINAPQTDILIAGAIVYLYRQMLQPGTGTTAVSGRYAEALNFWEGELVRRRGVYRMPPPPVYVKYGFPR